MVIRFRRDFAKNVALAQFCQSIRARNRSEFQGQDNHEDCVARLQKWLAGKDTMATVIIFGSDEVKSS